MRKNNKGFTLVELVIVIAVIAILASVLLPTFALVIENSKISSATQRATDAVKEYFFRIANLTSTDSIDNIDDLNGYIIIVENGSGAVDYKFSVSNNGKLENIIKGNFNETSKQFVYDINSLRKVLMVKNINQNLGLEEDEPQEDLGFFIDKYVDENHSINDCYIFTGTSNKIVD